MSNMNNIIYIPKEFNKQIDKLKRILSMLRSGNTGGAIGDLELFKIDMEQKRSKVNMKGTQDEGTKRGKSNKGKRLQ